MKNYRILNTCHNCNHVEKITEYDSGTEYYCNNDKVDRPDSGSIHMNEDFNMFDDDYKSKLDMWDKWRKGRRVDSFCVCDSYKK